MTPKPIRFALALLILTIAMASNVAAFESDDFNRNNLDADRWEFVNPLGDGSVRMTGVGTQDAHLELSVPEGPSHDPWHVNRAVRVMQTTIDDDFEVEARFVSEPAARHQLQGLLVEQDEDNWIRFDCLHDGTDLRLFAATTTLGNSSAKFNVVVSSGAAQYLRIKREADQWVLDRSSDGSNWITVNGFSHALLVSAVGVFVANHATSGNSPAFVAEIDYCFDVSAPVFPEDGSAAPDTLPPLIHGIGRAMEASAAVLSWFTDERALGTAEYGITPAYELGAVSDSGDTYDHAVTLDGLLPGSQYHYRLFSEDDSSHASMTDDMQFVFDPSGPAIDVWYGLTQSFGPFGSPQPWVNIFGNVSDSDGVSSLTYSLNAGPPVALSIGSDGRRLVSAGDFNADLNAADLTAGANTLLITATDQLDNISTETVTVIWQGGNVWPLPYSVNWSALTSNDEIQNVAQVVDGKWVLEGDAIRTAEPGYDRLVAIGDTTWTDYEVTAPITLNSSTSGHGVGVLMRWNGHTDNPVVCSQPKCGWLPLGAILWYRPGRLEVYGNGGAILDSSSRSLTIGTTYWFKGRVETTPLGALYRLKVWEDGEAEPTGWNVTGQADPGDPSHGSMVLITHQADASFGDVLITELAPPANLPPVANDDLAYVAPGDTVLINVLANDFDVDGFIDSTSVAIAIGSQHGTAAVDPVTGVITYVHDASPDPTDSLTYTVRDDDGDSSNEAFVSITISEDPIPRLDSDDFNRCVLDSQRWGFESPLGDGSFALVGAGTGDAWLELTLPAGSAHDAWGAGGQNEAIRVMQGAADTNFEVDVHWKAEPTGGYNDQGVLIEQDADNWLRFDIYHGNSSLKAFIGKTIGGSNTSLLNANIAAGSALYMRVARTGDTWTLRLSGDGVTYSQAGQFTQAINVTQVGVYAANPVDALDWTSQVDWFFDVQDPLALEDQGTLTVVVDIEGSGTVEFSPDLPVYECDDVVEVAASPDPGWAFDSWAGDLSGTNNPELLTIVGEMHVTATFVPDPTAVGPSDLSPGVFLFRGARPNPFAASTRIAFDLPWEAAVDVRIHSVSGRLVRHLLRGERLSPGRRTVVWDGRLATGEPAASGVYFCTVKAGGESATRRLLRMR